MSALLYLLPALLFALALLCGRYPGERLLLSIASRRRPAAPPVPPVAAPAPPLRLRSLPRGGALLAAALAGRAPPVAATARLDGAPSANGTSERRRSKMRRIAIAVAGAACVLAAPAAAQAHVSLHPNEVPAGSFATLALRVPSESDTADTVKVDVQVPPGFVDVSPEALPGWEVEVKTAKLAQPVESDDGPITEGVKEIIWTPSAGSNGIPPGQFKSFPISTEIPGKPGETLTFKVVQTYSDGEVARWIGAPESENPAPEIDVTAEGGVLQDVAGSEAEPPLPGEAGAEAGAGAAKGGSSAASASGGSSSESGSSGGASKGLAIAALVVGALGLLTGGAAFVSARRRSA